MALASDKLSLILQHLPEETAWVQRAA
jgi:hypothetical protein